MWKARRASCWSDGLSTGFPIAKRHKRFAVIDRKASADEAREALIAAAQDGKILDIKGMAESVAPKRPGSVKWRPRR